MKRANWLLLVALTVFVSALYFGCAQPDDIISPISTTSLRLSAQMLPPAPQEMTYELWIVKDTNYLSLGKFDYDLESKKFFDENGELRVDSNEFLLDGDIFSYDLALVSVETVPDDDTLVPGPIMLTDNITDPENDLIELTFPWSSDSLWYATCRYNLQTMSDTSSEWEGFTAADSIRSYNAGAGLWFSSYQIVERALQDTIRYDSFVIEKTWYDKAEWDSIIGGDKEDTTVVVDIINPHIDTSDLVLGLDTVEHIGFSFDDSTETFTSADSSFLITVVNFYLDTLQTDTVRYDLFTQDKFGLPDYSMFGWDYKGWVAAPPVGDCGASEGEFTLPAWGYTQTGRDQLPGYDGGMISTGTFTKINAPDNDGAKYALGQRVPPFPGDEFFINLPNNATGPLNLLPNDEGNEGIVFISLEPNNFTTDTTNFPLIPFIDKLPSSRDIFKFSDDLQEEIETMDNKTNTNDPYWGFPKVTIDIQRY